MSAEVPGWAEVYRGRDRDQWLELALVLEALGIDHGPEQDEGGYCLLVVAGAEQRARLELTEYLAEAQDPPQVEPRAPDVGSGSGFLPGYWCALLTFHAFGSYRVFGYDWWEAGSAQARLVVEGEWWRTVTALTLHADGSHLLNNLVFGSLFGVLLAQDVGVGWAWLGLVLSGALGNGLNAWLHPPEHASIGASTGVFGAVGLLMGVQFRKPVAARRSRLRRWAPPVIGAVFLGLLGTAGERTDVMAHLTGVAVGMAMGWGAGVAAWRWRLALRAQAVPAGAALLILAAAWWLALRG
ncbi:MAG: rhomboid family intramembrane serine protease [Gemmatimonadota bacterium]